MPTKPNRAGQQQNYVPKGNGDASGEYGDNATGSNKHFTAFKQPDKTENKPIDTPNKVVEPPKEEVKSGYLDDQKREWKYQQNYETYIGMITSGIMKHQDLTTEIERDEFKKKLRNIFNNANPNAMETISIAMQKTPFEFSENRFNASGSYYYSSMRQIYIAKNEMFDRGFEEQGSSLFHEVGHYMNDTMRIREKHLWYMDRKKLTDAESLFEDEISVADTLQDELKEFAANKYAPKIRKDKYKYVDEKLKQYGFTAKEFEKKLEEGHDAFKSAEWVSIKDEIKNRFDNGEFGSVKDANIELKKRLEIWKKTGSYKELYAEIDEKRPYYKAACNEWYKKTGIQAVSDAWSSKSDFGFGLGHDRQYYSKKYSNEEPKSMVADEFWANFFAAYTTNEKAALETTQKYFPRTYEKMLKLVEYIKSQKGKDQ